MNVRAAAANVLFQVVDKGHSLSHALPAAQKRSVRETMLYCKEICYGALRYLPRLKSMPNELMENSAKNLRRIFTVVLVGIYQLSFSRIRYAAVAETVEATKHCAAQTSVV